LAVSTVAEYGRRWKRKRPDSLREIRGFHHHDAEIVSIIPEFTLYPLLPRLRKQGSFGCDAKERPFGNSSFGSACSNRIRPLVTIQSPTFMLRSSARSIRRLSATCLICPIGFACLSGRNAYSLSWRQLGYPATKRTCDKVE